MPGWTSLWASSALFYAVASPSQDKLSGLWGGCSFTFHTFHLWDSKCSTSSHFFSCASWVLIWNPYTTGHQFVYFCSNSSPFRGYDVHFWLRRGCYLYSNFTKAFVLLPIIASPFSGVGAFHWISPDPSSVHFGPLPRNDFCLNMSPLACFYRNSWCQTSLGACRHSVSDNFVQLTEGRSARIYPSSHQQKKATEAASSMFPYCCPSSSRKRSTVREGLPSMLATSFAGFFCDCYGFTFAGCWNCAHWNAWNGIGIIGYKVLKTLWEPGYQFQKVVKA